MADQEAQYWQTQITAAQNDSRHRRWISVGQQFQERYRLESAGLYMHGDIDLAGRGLRMIYNLLWSNVQTMLPMLYSKRPDPHVSRRFHNSDPVARMASTITERAVSTDLDAQDFDDQAQACALDYQLVGRGTMRAVYEHTTQNARIPIREENREDGEPRYFTDADEEIPRDMVERDVNGIFVIDPQTTQERAPIEYHNWRDFLIGPGRKWDEVQRHGWINYTTYMTKAQVAKRFGQDAATGVTYEYSPFDPGAHQRLGKDADKIVSSLGHLAVINETWSATSRKVYWTSPGYTELLDKQDDYLGLVGFFNTPRPLLSTFTNETLIPVPDYAEYHSQAQEMDQITGKIEQIVEEIRAGGVYNAAIASLGSALRNKSGGYHACDEWALFAQNGGMNGAVQEFLLRDKVEAVAALYQHRANVKKDSDEISGMIDLFRGQQTQEDETLGQSQIRASMGGLRINHRQRDFQRYIRDCLAMKAEIIVSKFDEERILEMADMEALMQESPQVATLTAIIRDPGTQQALQQQAAANPMAAAQMLEQGRQMLEQARGQQMTIIRAALDLLKNDQMRTFRLDIETDATVALDENMEKAQAGNFVKVIGEYFNNVLGSPAMAQTPQLKALAAEMLMFLVRRFKIGRSLEQKIEATVESLVKMPQQPPPPDPLMLDVQRQAQDDQMDHQTDLQKNAIDAFKAQTDRMKAEVSAMEAAKDGNREDLKLAADILEHEDEVLGNA